MKKIAALIAVLALAGCAAPSGGKMEETADFDTLISQAEAAAKKANSMGAEWRDTGKFIKEAKEAASKGDMEKAVQIAKKAKFEGDMAAKQAESQKNAGPWLF